MTSIAETGTSQATAEERKATKKARAGAPGANVAPAKAKSAKKAKASKKIKFSGPSANSTVYAFYGHLARLAGLSLVQVDLSKPGGQSEL